MKKIINGKKYDTSTATYLASASSDVGRNSFDFWEETLYRKNTGEYFLYAEGGPMSVYAVSIGQNSWSGGKTILPLTLEEACKWSEEHLDGDAYEEIFGPVSE